MLICVPLSSSTVCACGCPDEATCSSCLTIMHFCVARTRPLPASSFAIVLSNRLSASYCGRYGNFTWSSHNTCTYPLMRGLSSVADLGSLAPLASSCMVVVVITIVVWIYLASLRPRGCWKDATSALAIVEQAKRDKHLQMNSTHRFDFPPICLLFSFGLF